jgi:hypothetical protein
LSPPLQGLLKRNTLFKRVQKLEIRILFESLDQSHIRGRFGTAPGNPLRPCLEENVLLHDLFRLPSLRRHVGLEVVRFQFFFQATEPHLPIVL